LLTLPPFTYHAPKTVSEAVALLGQYGVNAKLIAGGTDLVPNMKHRLFTPEHVVGLKDVAELHRITERDGALCLGAMVSIADVARHARVNAVFPSLAKAASQIAGPQLREMGTLGGNLALDTRCVYYNQTYFWRKALGFCLKKDGTVCHVVKGGQKCVAAASNDTAPALLSLGATVRLTSPRGTRELPLEQFYVADGIRNTVLEPDELLTEARVLLPQGRLVTGYQKLRIRAAIDYPALTVAVAAWLEKDGTAQWIRMVLSALGAKPHPIKRLEHLFGKPLNDETVSELGQIAYRQCHPLTNINVDTGWRREMIPIFVRRAWKQALLPRDVERNA
jgi:4-hydroxybenzoyl-CoA reductase subunit beta